MRPLQLHVRFGWIAPDMSEPGTSQAHGVGPGMWAGRLRGSRNPEPDALQASLGRVEDGPDSAQHRRRVIKSTRGGALALWAAVAGLLLMLAVGRRFRNVAWRAVMRVVRES